MKTALAADEPERRPTLQLVGNLVRVPKTEHWETSPTTTVQWKVVPPTTAATFPQQIIGPWQCPDCKTWMAPHVREHRCP